MTVLAQWNKEHSTSRVRGLNNEWRTKDTWIIGMAVPLGSTVLFGPLEHSNSENCVVSQILSARASIFCVLLEFGSLIMKYFLANSTPPICNPEHLEERQQQNNRMSQSAVLPHKTTTVSNRNEICIHHAAIIIVWLSCAGIKEVCEKSSRISVDLEAGRVASNALERQSHPTQSIIPCLPTHGVSNTFKY